MRMRRDFLDDDVVVVDLDLAGRKDAAVDGRLLDRDLVVRGGCDCGARKTLRRRCKRSVVVAVLTWPILTWPILTWPALTWPALTWRESRFGLGRVRLLDLRHLRRRRRRRRHRPRSLLGHRSGSGIVCRRWRRRRCRDARSGRGREGRGRRRRRSERLQPQRCGRLRRARDCSRLGLAGVRRGGSYGGAERLLLPLVERVRPIHVVAIGASSEAA